MVSKTDLRLGNIFKEGVVCKINGRAGAKVHVCGRLEYKDGKLKNRTEVPAESLTPIPLSPQVLVEWCGYQEKGDGVYDCEAFSLIWNGKYFWADWEAVKLDFLHELQNFHYVLNQKQELEIKE